MLETQMCRQQALHETLFKNYLLEHCLSWYTFARDLGVQVEFGDIMLVTECSKTAAWASAVYSQSSKEFGMSFSTGGAFLPAASGVVVSTGQERIGPVEYRRSQRLAISLVGVEGTPKDHTVFVKGYRLGSRSLYLRSLARKIMKAKNRPRAADQGQDDSRGISPSSADNGSRPSFLAASRKSSHPSEASLELVGSMDGATSLFPEWPVRINKQSSSRHQLICFFPYRTSILRSPCLRILWRSVVTRLICFGDTSLPSSGRQAVSSLPLFMTTIGVLLTAKRLEE